MHRPLWRVRLPGRASRPLGEPVPRGAESVLREAPCCLWGRGLRAWWPQTPPPICCQRPLKAAGGPSSVSGTRGRSVASTGRQPAWRRLRRESGRVAGRMKFTFLRMKNTSESLNCPLRSTVRACYYALGHVLAGPASPRRDPAGISPFSNGPARGRFAWLAVSIGAREGRVGLAWAVDILLDRLGRLWWDLNSTLRFRDPSQLMTRRDIFC